MLSLRIVFILANSEGLDEIPPYLGLRCLTKYMYTGIQNENSFIISHEIMACNKIDKTTSGLQIFGKRYDVHKNVAYIMTKL